ncbi:MAG TPA: hypothetical protein V6D16_21135 [Candidatus Obscuribacterales bacterium]
MNPNLRGLDIPVEVFEALELRAAATGIDKTDLVVEALRQNLDLAQTVEHLSAEIETLKANDQKLGVDVSDLNQKVKNLEGKFTALKIDIERNTEIALTSRVRCARAIAQSRDLVAQARNTRKALAESRQRRS